MDGVLLVDAMDGGAMDHAMDLTYKNLIKLTFSCPKYSIKIYLQSLLYHHHSQEYFFNCNITSSPYVEMLLISIIKLFFISS